MIVKDVQIYRYNRGSFESRLDRIVCESRLSLYVNDGLLIELAVTDRDLDALIVGILHTHGLLRKGEIPRIERAGSECHVRLEGNPSNTFNIASEKRTHFTISPENLQSLLKEFQQLPSVYHETGGVHMAALAEETIRFWADDISRRSAVDKVIGKAYMDGWNMRNSILFTSCRISFDLIRKMASVSLSLIVSLSAPTDKALAVAERAGITLCGFARDNRFNIYTHPERILGIPERS